jgi:hypothetical protein
MEIADVRKHVKAAMERARRTASDRRARADEAARAYETFLERVAVPLVRQVENVLRAEGYPFKTNTPGGSVRLISERSGEDYIEIGFDGGLEPPSVVGRTSRARGRRVIETEHVIGGPADLQEEDVLKFLLKELEPLVER